MQIRTHERNERPSVPGNEANLSDKRSSNSSTTVIVYSTDTSMYVADIYCIMDSWTSGLTKVHSFSAIRTPNKDASLYLMSKTDIRGVVLCRANY